MDDRHRAEEYCRQRLSADPLFDVPSYFYDQRLGWIELIKSLRALRGYGLYEAQKEALQCHRWKTWVLDRIKHDRVCAKQAQHHVRTYGDAALIELPHPSPSLPGR